MPIDFACMTCGQPYAVRDELAGRLVRCKRCDVTFEIPPPGAIELGIGTDGPGIALAPIPASQPYRFEYKMVQVPPDLSIAEGVSYDDKAANYLERIVNRLAADGWEFHRIDPIGIQVTPGCLSALFMAFLPIRPTRLVFNVVSFRRRIVA